MQHAARACRGVGRQVAQSPLGGAVDLATRGLATATPADEVVDQMIAYARDHYRDNPDQVDDILKGGLAMDVSGISQQRLWLARADTAAEWSDWRQSAGHAAAAYAAPAPSDAPGATEGKSMAVYSGVAALLADGQDVEAGEALERPGVGRLAGPSHAALLAMLGTTFRACTAEDIAFFQSCSAAQPPEARAALDREVAAAQLTQAWTAGAYAPACLDGSTVMESTARAVDTATAAATAQGSHAALGPLSSPLRCGEALADAHLLRAQVHGLQGRWEESEESLAAALSVVEGVSAGGHPRLAFPLALLAHVYSRTARVTLAEGLYREATKLLQLDPRREAPSVSAPAAPAPAHWTVGAMLSWRYGQLLTALPRRGTEAAAWQALGLRLAEPLSAIMPMQTLLGPLDVLTQKGAQPVPGMLLSLPFRRAVPLVSCTMDPP
ncbi:hypothetical protein ACKKBF_B03815 [Auxenochlorella protothecoides x Auxenochlorella symbiontica]